VGNTQARPPNRGSERRPLHRGSETNRKTDRGSVRPGEVDQATADASSERDFHGGRPCPHGCRQSTRARPNVGAARPYGVHTAFRRSHHHVGMPPSARRRSRRARAPQCVPHNPLKTTRSPQCFLCRALTPPEHLYGGWAGLRARHRPQTPCSSRVRCGRRIHTPVHSQVRTPQQHGVARNDALRDPLDAAKRRVRRERCA
jgi:hypothetical protein